MSPCHESGVLAAAGPRNSGVSILESVESTASIFASGILAVAVATLRPTSLGCKLCGFDEPAILNVTKQHQLLVLR